MSKSKIYVGLDYHKETVQVCVMDESGKVLCNKATENHWQRIVEIFPDGDIFDVRAALEASTGASDLADELVQLAGWSVDQAHPGYVARIKQSPDKTDFSDAQLLADLERVGYLPRVWHPPLFIRNLRRMVRFRQQLVAHRRAVKQRIRALLRDHRIADPKEFAPWTKGWLRWVQEVADLTEDSRWIMAQHLEELQQLALRIAAAERRLAESTKEDRLVQKLLEQKGVGPITAVTIRAEIGRYDRFRSGKQLSRFCGLSPRNESSGGRQATAGVIKAGNPELRRVIVELAQRLARHDPHYSKMCSRMLANGKKKCVAIAAIANRWLRKHYHDMKEFGMAA
ncbi:MAG: IS110 family transposase [Planctomycetota bacterium]